MPFYFKVDLGFVAEGLGGIQTGFSHWFSEQSEQLGSPREGGECVGHCLCWGGYFTSGVQFFASPFLPSWRKRIGIISDSHGRIFSIPGKFQPIYLQKKGQTELWSNIPRQISRLHYLSHSLSIGFEVRRGTWTLGVSTGPCPAAWSEVGLSLCDSCALSAVGSSTAEVLGGKRACVWSVHL